jgi:membrane-associated protease RseP (regulator of RpoE activity)
MENQNISQNIEDRRIESRKIKSKKIKKISLHILLFIATLLTTTLAGAEWMTGKSVFFSSFPFSFQELLGGLYFSIPFLAILTTHEFGHYFTAKYYGLDVTMPFYIPVWFFSLLPSIGTMGAFIRIESPIGSRKVYFDVGFAGPWAGFVVALGVIIYGFTHLPPVEYIFGIHPEYAVYGADYAKYVYDGIPEGMTIVMGTNLLFEFMKMYVADPMLIPNQFEIIHYPYIFAGYLACFFTALNLIPIGQLDGGHILYGLVGYKTHRILSLISFGTLLFWGGLGFFSMHTDTESLLYGAPLYVLFLYFCISKTFTKWQNTLLMAVCIFTAQYLVASFAPQIEGFNGWLVFGFLIGRVLGVYHPPVYDERPVNTPRIIIGIISLLIFVVCFSPTPLVIK